MEALTEIKTVLLSIMEIREASWETTNSKYPTGYYTKSLKQCLSEAMELHNTPVNLTSLLEEMTIHFDLFYGFYCWAEKSDIAAAKKSEISTDGDNFELEQKAEILEDIELDKLCVTN